MTLRPLMNRLEQHRQFADRAEALAHRFSPTVIAKVVEEHRQKAADIQARLQDHLPELEQTLELARTEHAMAQADLLVARECALRVVIGELPAGEDVTEAAEARLEEASARVLELTGMLNTLSPIACAPLEPEVEERVAILIIDDQALYPLQQPAIGIGRARSNQIQLGADSLVSRRHCIIEQHDRDWHIRDLGSANGTWLGGEPIGSRRLLGGEVIQVGGTVLRFEWADRS